MRGRACESGEGERESFLAAGIYISKKMQILVLHAEEDFRWQGAWRINRTY